MVTLTLEEETRALGPWALEIEVAPGLTTAVGRQDGRAPDEPGIGVYDPRPEFEATIRHVYPDLAGKSVLDCGCNCGAYLFIARDLGATRCFGFDAREHWIRQARFLQRQLGSDGIEIQQMTVEDLAGAGLVPFDVVNYQGIFYHLPDPLHSLRFAANLAKETLIFNTATRPADVPALVARTEGIDAPMSGLDGPCFYPSGPEAVTPFLDWLGFDVRVLWDHADSQRMHLLATRRSR